MQLDFISFRVLWLGIGCQTGVSQKVINIIFEKVLQEFSINQSDIVGIATIDSKAREIGLIEFCNLYNLPLKTFSAALLSSVVVPNPTSIVNKIVQTPSVAEAAAILAASGLTTRGKLLVPKQILHLPGEKAVTIAIAKERKFNQQPGENN
ncbi:MAG TPA: cobalamin biosynthesis protein [Nostocaceae cyanobacterium]|nr:cobalamin biosynthesis protein [Nostocaceae cyanobacterium]